MIINPFFKVVYLREGDGTFRISSYNYSYYLLFSYTILRTKKLKFCYLKVFKTPDYIPFSFNHDIIFVLENKRTLPSPRPTSSKTTRNSR